MQGIQEALDRAGVPAVVTGFPGIFHVGFGLEAPARNYRDLTRLEPARLHRLHDGAPAPRRARAGARRMVPFDRARR